MIVDDGGHTRKQQVNSLIGLWPYVRKNGGIYVIEDIFTSFISSFNDNKESTIDLMFELIIILNNPSPASFGPPHHLPNVEISQHAIEISKELASLKCFLLFFHIFFICLAFFMITLTCLRTFKADSPVFQ